VTCHTGAHLNLIESSRQLFELDPDAAVEAESGWLLGAGSPSHPVISNAAFRIDDSVDAGELIARARDFFGERGRGFSVWVRGDLPEDEDLVEASRAAGLKCVHEAPEMVLAKRVETRLLPANVELRRLSAEEEAGHYWQVAASSYTSLGFPPEVFGYYTNLAGLLADNVAAFVAYLDGKPVSIAMTIVSHGVAGVYWVGTLDEARGMGLARATTAAATNAGFEMGADLASLQASPMGKPIYSAMGYETVFDYRLLMSPPR
jgi:ribosomal protein S18 acetylase RimI-like enzyme